MEIVQVGSKTQSFDSTFDILLDMRGRVRDSSSFPENLETAFRRDYYVMSCLLAKDGEVNVPKTLSRRLCFLMNSPSNLSFAPAP